MTTFSTMRKKLWFVIKVIFSCSFVLVILGFAFLYFADMPRYEVKKVSFNATPTDKRIAEGKRIALTMCIKCHYDGATNTLSGNSVSNPKEVEDSYSSNITKDSVSGLGLWKDSELAFFLRTGINRKGRYVFDMPKYPLLSDDDLSSIIVFLRSDDSLVRPIQRKINPPKPNMAIKFFAYTYLHPYSYPSSPIANPDTNNLVEFGRYLATKKFSCFDCHSHDLIGNVHNDAPEKSTNFFGGGNPHADDDHNIVLSANLTFDKETGIGNWSEDQFLKAVKNGIKPNGTMVHEPMFPFYLLTDKEAKAIYQYLSTVKTIKN